MFVFHIFFFLYFSLLVWVFKHMKKKANICFPCDFSPRIHPPIKNRLFAALSDHSWRAWNVNIVKILQYISTHMASFVEFKYISQCVDMNECGKFFFILFQHVLYVDKDDISVNIVCCFEFFFSFLLTCKIYIFKVLCFKIWLFFVRNFAITDLLIQLISIAHIFSLQRFAKIILH